MFFSVLIPAYNVEKYIDKCLNSILVQKFVDFEIIIIDDGSKDSTYKICKQYQEINGKIKLIHQENKGIAFTRNQLLKKAKGDWLIFIDADDYIKDNLLSSLYHSINKNKNADAIICDYYCIDNNNSLRICKEPFKNKTEYINKLIHWNSVNTALWAKAIRKTFIDEYNVKFEEDITLGEDLCFMSRLFYYAKEIIYLPKALYVWNRTNTNSITSQGKHQYDLITLYERIIQFYKEKKDYATFKKSLDKSVIRLMEFLYVYKKCTSFGFLPSTINKSNLSLIELIEYYLIKHKLYKLTCIAEKIRRNINNILYNQRSD